ncbi:MAG TPA: restriction endonuclease, partial [Kofleriaceae bacterium]|nr:restriction endonuclease [Kofleriaceae bacterium]
MAKKQSAGEASAEAAKKRRPQKKTAAPKAGAKKSPAKPAKPAKSAKPARPGAKKPREASSQAEVPITDVHVVEPAVPEEATVDSTIESEPVAAPPRADLAGSTTEEVVEVEEPIPALSPEEQEIAALYGDDLAKPAVVHTEYTDRQTADEDRPMVPEINARDERKQQWQERRERRRQRRDERDRQRHERRDQLSQSRPSQSYDARLHDSRPYDSRPFNARLDQRGEPAHGAAEPRQPYPQPPRPAQPALPPAAPATNGQDHDALARVGTPLGDAAATVFAQLRNGQPLPVRQLAAMMRKRNLIETDPEQLWPQLKAELLGDERSYRTLGLRPRIVYRGRDLFAPGPVAMSQTAEAEATVAAALSRLAGATHRALAARIGKASSSGFERLIHAYLVAAGYREIAWVKRVGGIAYAQAVAPGIDRPVLISARSGDQPIDRRGIGELRVGVEAKNLVAGILFSPRELSEDAERELERAGRSIAVICGDQLVAALIATGVGVVSS